MATRTWVSGVGDDANPGSRTAPCKTFAGALSKTDSGGEIDCLDPGGFGPVTITKSLTIDGTGTFGSILAAGTNGIIINGAGITVTIRGLSINGAGTGISGVQIVAAAKVHIIDCIIAGFGAGVARGINDVRTAGGRLFVTNTTVRDNGQSGVVALPTSGSNAIQAVLENCRLEGNGNAGLVASSGSRVTIARSIAVGNLSHGLFADSPAGSSELTIESCVVAANGTDGIFAGSGATIRISNVLVTNNGIGLSGPGVYATFGNNHLSGNASGNSVPGSPAPIGAQ
ncbi:MAG: right-handed parallel beta-helix repeat-containing protein [Acidobacteriota bacterium]